MGAASPGGCQTKITMLEPETRCVCGSTAALCEQRRELTRRAKDGALGRESPGRAAALGSSSPCRKRLLV